MAIVVDLVAIEVDLVANGGYSSGCNGGFSG